MTVTVREQAAMTWPLEGKTALDLMSPNPVSIEADATAEEAMAFLADANFSAAPVIDEAGHPVGVLSRIDLLVHQRELVARLAPGQGGSSGPPREPDRVRDVMTPVILAVAPETPAAAVLGQMVDQNVHRLFVVDGTGVLIGVISAVDLLRQLRPPEAPGRAQGLQNLSRVSVSLTSGEELP